ncbi:MAG TPA: hypothetical protein VGK19_10035 [Capsulimonadaceae bacterium]|jgi:hypothetical protein
MTETQAETPAATTSQQEPLSVAYTPTKVDWLRYELLLARGTNLPIEYWTIDRVGSAFIFVFLFAMTVSMYAINAPMPVDLLGFVLLLLFLFGWMVVGPHLAVAMILHRQPHLTDEVSITLHEDYVHVETRTAEECTRWYHLRKLAWCDGDALVSSARLDGHLIPQRAFPSKAAAESFMLHVVNSAVQVTRAINAAPPIAECDPEVWPPPASSAYVALPTVKPIGEGNGIVTLTSTFEAEDAVAREVRASRSYAYLFAFIALLVFMALTRTGTADIAHAFAYVVVGWCLAVATLRLVLQARVQGALKLVRNSAPSSLIRNLQTVRTDFEDFAVLTQHSVLSTKVSSILNVELVGGGLFVHLSPRSSVWIPNRCFADAAATRAFANQLKAAITAQKRNLRSQRS